MVIMLAAWALVLEFPVKGCGESSPEVFGLGVYPRPEDDNRNALAAKLFGDAIGEG